MHDRSLPSLLSYHIYPLPRRNSSPRWTAELADDRIRETQTNIDRKKYIMQLPSAISGYKKKSERERENLRISNERIAVGCCRFTKNLIKEEPQISVDEYLRSYYCSSSYCYPGTYSLGLCTRSFGVIDNQLLDHTLKNSFTFDPKPATPIKQAPWSSPDSKHKR